MQQQCLSFPPTTRLHALCCPNRATVLLAVHVTHAARMSDQQLAPGWWLLHVELDPGSASSVVHTASITAALALPGCPRHLVAANQTSGPECAAWLVVQDGRVFTYTMPDAALQPAPALLKGCDVVRAAAGAVVALAGSDLVVGGRVVSRDCTSMLVVENRPEVAPLLMWTTRGQRLHMEPLETLQNATSAPLVDAVVGSGGAGVLTVQQGEEGDCKEVMRDAMRPKGGGGGLMERAVEWGSMLLAAPHGAVWGMWVWVVSCCVVVLLDKTYSFHGTRLVVA